MEELLNKLNSIQKSIVTDEELDEEEEIIRKKNQEIMDRFNAINN